MIICRSDQVVLRLLWEASGRSTSVPAGIDEIARRVVEIQKAGVPVFSSRDLVDVRTCVLLELQELEALGYAEIFIADGRAEISGVGDLLAADLEWPDFVKVKMDAAGAPSPRPA